MNPSYPFPVIIIELISHFYVYVPIGNELDTSAHESDFSYDHW
jgi:hypothetical protein